MVQINLSIFSSILRHPSTAWERHDIKELFASALCDVKFLLYCSEEFQIKQTKAPQNVLKASDSSNDNVLLRLLGINEQLYVILEFVKFLFTVLQRI